MKFKNKSYLLFLLLLVTVALVGQTINGLPLHIKKLSDNAIRLWVGDHISSTAVCALNTAKGIVVIDTTQCPTLDEQFRKIIAKKFNRKDFIYLINTHEHGDHTSGNSVYADCEIIAHEKCPEGMKRIQADQQRVIEWSKNYLPRLKKQLHKAKEGTDQYQKIKEDIIVRKMRLKALEKGIKLTLPTKTFKDEMKLNLGNMTLELYYLGGLHTASDILILVPEEGLLFTGDVMADIWLTDTPGCLQSFGGRLGLNRDLTLMLQNWKSLIDRQAEIKDYIPGHWNGDLTYTGFVARYHYLQTLQKEIKKAVKENKGLKELVTELNLKNKFPKLAGTPGFTRDFTHNNNIIAIWSEITGAKSASQALGEMIKEKGLKKAINKVWKEYQKGSKSKKYFYFEQDFNRLGYQYLNQKKYPEAIAVFKLNVAMYPKSWNVYDSLGEAYLNNGQKKLAFMYYKKSLNMNPQKTEGEKRAYKLQIKTVEKLSMKK